MRVGVVVPARDEEDRIEACLRSVRAALDRAGVPGRICVVADRCTDGTAVLAARHARVVPSEGPRTVGELRDLGLRALPTADWLLSTDADSVVPPTWVADHLRHAAAGADAVAGPVDLDRELSGPVAERYRRLLSSTDGHAYAANLGVRASAYDAVGGFPAVPHGEEHALLARLHEAGFRVVRPPDVRVRTSARTDGRAAAGLADLLDGLGA
jgi:glycosyltransferase involved in cell wall biosynthesis